MKNLRNELMEKMTNGMLKMTLDYSETSGQCFFLGIDEIEMPKEILYLTEE
ncbi:MULTISPECIES: hypothetical protein [unclassified Fusibacter]|uniref:hypothetical protein n=1 Tax=unclassified Fusibacter TaxID=2624464 RepID=UPI0013E9772F|nr:MULTISPECIES: hypothetical protein [unclassified Fusibacter]MCK8058219.1 hypothetical protein [Fusibacter sp. A2]NPE20802.1 hypothetical protein [Fusibacter sp. A1]